MKQSAENFYADFIGVFKKWAEGADDVRAAYLIGSRAREDHPADAWSDMDILFFTTNPAYYLTQSEWLDRFGKALCSFSTCTAGGDPERLALFEDGYQVDFVVAHTDELNRLARAKATPGNFYRGVKVLTDKDSVSPNILPKDFHAPAAKKISEAAFGQVCHTFWFVVLYVAKQILRGELWVAKARDCDLKALLLQMVEWYEKCLHGEAYDTWHAGRFLREWSDADVWEDMQRCFGHFDARDSWNALTETARLFKRLSHSVASQMNYPISEAEGFIDAWMDSHRADLFGGL